MSKPEPIKISEKCLKDFFGIKHLHLKCINDNNKWSLERSNKVANFITIDNKYNEYIIWEFPIKEEYQIRLNNKIYISYNISLVANEEIKEVNIKIFKEVETANEQVDIKVTELILRAEWSNIESGEESKHAQPHWHIHPFKVIDWKEYKKLPENDKNVFKEMLDESHEDNNFINTGLGNEVENTNNTTQNQQPNNEGELQMYKFHLAMVADWDLEHNNKEHIKQLNNKKLKQWLPQCLEYIKTQIEYMLEKLSKP